MLCKLKLPASRHNEASCFSPIVEPDTCNATQAPATYFRDMSVHLFLFQASLQPRLQSHLHSAQQGHQGAGILS